MRRQSLLSIAILFVGLLFGFRHLPAGAATMTVTPESGTENVPTNEPIVFTFNSPVVVEQSTFSFITIAGSIFQPVFPVITWDAGFMTATCLPSSGWRANAQIFWAVSVECEDGDTVDDVGDFFTAGTGTGSGTNVMTTFHAGVYHEYTQTGSSGPVPDPEAPYTVLATVSIASNVTATAVTLTTPTSDLLDLIRSPFAAEDFFYFDATNNLADFNTLYPAGLYQFSLSGTPVLTANANLPAATQQPNAPRVVNYTAAQSVDATQPFTLSWEAFSGGTANDFIQLEVGDGIWSSPDMGKPGALTGTATSITIPANTLEPNTAYTNSLSFVRGVFSTNSSTQTAVWTARGTRTTFPIQTAGGGQPVAPRLTNQVVVNGRFQFQAVAPAGQSLTLLASDTLASNSWVEVITTNAVAPATLFDVPRQLTGWRFYRLRSP